MNLFSYQFVTLQFEKFSMKLNVYGVENACCDEYVNIVHSSTECTRALSMSNPK